jgi:hypothetical protein
MKALSRCVVVLALLAAGCGEAPVQPTPVAPGPPTVLESFSDMLQPQGTNHYRFNVEKAGYVEVTLLAIGPPPTTTVGLGIGKIGGSTTCSIIPVAGVNPVMAQAGTSAQIPGQLTNSGTFCVSIYDVGTLDGPVVYTLTIAHP